LSTSYETVLERVPHMRSISLTIGILCVVGLATALVIWGLGIWPQRFNVEKNPAVFAAKSPPTVELLSRPEIPESGYVGSAACAKCHAKIAETYKRHPMSRSLATVQTAEPLEDYQNRVSFEAGPCVYRVEHQNGTLKHHESLTDTDGTPLYDISTEIQYVMGSGTRGRSYLTLRNDILSTSSIGWYSKQGWDLSPGYRPDDHPHFNRRVTESCLQCHAGRVNVDRSNVDHFPPPPFLELAIGCERCHGPGEQHVAFHGRETKRPVSDPIVNPSRLPTAEREAVCNQCHLQAKERILRYGRSHQDFRPGQRINEIWTVFLNDAPVTSARSTALVAQVEQMQSSRCFQQSEGRMGCTSCHDPHDVPSPEARSNYYQNKCLNCHAEQGCTLEKSRQLSSPANGNCVVCHMPQMNSEDVPHSSQSDHRISRRSQSPAGNLVRHPVRNSLEQPLTVFEEPGFRLSKVEMKRARGLMLSRTAEQTRDISLAREAEVLLKPVLAAAPDDAPVLESLGTACLLQSRQREARDYWHQILRTSPRHEQALLKLCRLAHDSGNLEETRVLLTRFLNVNPTLPQLLFMNAQVLAEQGEFDAATSFAKQASFSFPRRLQLYDWLADLYSRQGNLAESERYRDLRLRIARRLRPQ